MLYALCTTVVCKAAYTSSDNLSSYSMDSHHHAVMQSVEINIVISVTHPARAIALLHHDGHSEQHSSTDL